LKLAHPEKFLKLETFCKRPYFSATDAYEMGQSKESRRQDITESILSEVTSVEPSRLLTLLGQSMRFQQSQGILPPGKTFDLFRNTKKTFKHDVEDRVTKFEHTTITAISFPTSCPYLLFSPSGENFILGNNYSLRNNSCSSSSGDSVGKGEIEVWDTDICQLRKDLSYQEKGEYLHQDSPVLCSTFSKDGDYIAVGSFNGNIKIFRISTGVCMKTLPSAHRQGITSLQFARDGTQLLSASYDQTARIHGLKSGKSLREFRGHTSFVNSAVYLKDQVNNIMTASSDGTVKIWDSKTTECLVTLRPGLQAGMSSFTETPIHTLLHVPTAADQWIACTKSTSAMLINTLGQTVRTFHSGKVKGGDFVSATISPHGKWLYCAGEDKQVYIFDVKTGELEDVIPIAIEGAHEIVQILHHPNRNLVGVVTNAGKIQILVPS
jgi:WD40 repeat-containing protein SMU1